MILFRKPDFPDGQFLLVKKVTRKWWFFWKMEVETESPPMIMFSGNTKIEGNLKVAGDIRIGKGLKLSVSGNATAYHVYASKLITGTIDGDVKGIVGETIVTNETAEEYLKRMSKGDD